MKTKTLTISMAYTYVGDTSIEIPIDILEGKSRDEQYEIAYDYAREHLGDIPVSSNVKYIPDSDNFELCDIKFDDEEEEDEDE